MRKNIMELTLVNYDDPILKQESERFNFDNPPFNILEFSEALAKKMIAENGLGLAAPQVGHSYRIFAMASTPATIVINPRIVEMSEETVLLDEGCLSYPGLAVKIRRPRMIKVRFTFPSNESQTMTLDGMSARVFLHEYDHLIGVCHIDRAHKFHKEQAMNRWKKVKRARKAIDKFVQV